jgi:hypothetical protein
VKRKGGNELKSQIFRSWMIIYDESKLEMISVIYPGIRTGANINTVLRLKKT